MVDRIASDHPSISTIRASVVRHGGRGRRIELSSDGAVIPETGVIEVIVDGRRRFGRCRTIADTPSIVGLYDTRAAATGDIDGENGLTSVLTAMDRPSGGSVLIDVIEPCQRIGFRAPGESAVYDAVRSRDSTLDDIARKFGGERDRT